jgi:enamine deaminase RidA (YjgF/YER057c/UK114 family)
VVRGEDAEYLGLSDVAGGLPGPPSRSAEEETRAAFRLAEGLLAGRGWSFTDVCRTWFYLDRILDWYETFNHVRNAEFSRLGLLAPDRVETIPASTGILGRGRTGRHCTLDLLAVRSGEGEPFAVRRLINPQQNEAPEYGSAFSRGLAVTAGRGEYLFVSGTAAIDTHGASLHPGDFEGQVRETVDLVNALLAAVGSSFADIGQATAFVKRPGDVEVLGKVLADLGVPVVCTLADVCRDELLFELDAAVVRAAGETGRVA